MRCAASFWRSEAPLKSRKRSTSLSLKTTVPCPLACHIEGSAKSAAKCARWNYGKQLSCDCGLNHATTTTYLEIHSNVVLYCDVVHVFDARLCRSDLHSLFFHENGGAAVCIRRLHNTKLDVFKAKLGNLLAQKVGVPGCRCKGQCSRT